jgi:carbon storage regulator
LFRKFNFSFCGPGFVVLAIVQQHSIREVKIMLVLTRKEGEQLLIGDNIVITINRISGNRVAIGVEAPREVRVVRSELEKLQISAEKPAAAGTSAVSGMSSGRMNVAVASSPNA